jgi:hypothetical protein
MATANGRGGTITKILLSVNKKSVTPVFRIHFFNANDATLSADNAAWQDKYADASKRAGYIDMLAMTTATDTTNSDMSRTYSADVNFDYLCTSTSTSMYWTLELIGGTLTLDNASEFTLKVTTRLN